LLDEDLFHLLQRGVDAFQRAHCLADRAVDLLGPGRLPDQRHHLAAQVFQPADDRLRLALGHLLRERAELLSLLLNTHENPSRSMNGTSAEMAAICRPNGPNWRPALVVWMCQAWKPGHQFNGMSIRHRRSNGVTSSRLHLSGRFTTGGPSPSQPLVMVELLRCGIV